MSYKKITSALVAFTMLASMTALSANAEEADTPAEVPEVIETQAPAPVETEAPAPVETEAPKPVETDAPTPVETDAPAQIETAAPVQESESVSSETKSASETPETVATSSEAPETIAPSETGTATTAVSEGSTVATTAESINKDIAAPKLGDFIVTSGDSGSSAVISWSAVEGADGYEIQLVQTPQNGKSSTTSIPSTSKTAFQFDCGKEAMKATVRVRALKNGEKGSWAEKTVYLNGMKEETTKSTTKATTAKKTETTTTKKTETNKTESPKTSDSSAIPAVAGAAAVALLAGAVTLKKKED